MSRAWSSTASGAVAIVAAVVAGAALVWSRDILTPLALAFFLMVIIDALARTLRRVPRLPGPAALPLAGLATVAGFAAMAYLAGLQARGFALELVGDTFRLEQLYAQLARMAGVSTPPALTGLFSPAAVVKLLGMAGRELEGVGAQSAFVLVYLVLLFLSREGFRRKAPRLFRSEDGTRHAMAMFERIRGGVERYLWVQTLCALVVAGASFGLMEAVGLKDAAFWAFLVFVCAYIPIIGGAVGILLPPLFALLQFGVSWQAPTLLVGAEAVHFAVGNFIAPRMQGVSLNIDPVVVLLSLAFWGAMWGLAGTFMSTPLTVTAMVILAQFPATRWLAVLLSRDGDPAPADSTVPA